MPGDQLSETRLRPGQGDPPARPGRSGDGPDGDPRNCMLDRPHGDCIHRGVVYVTDSESHRIRAITGLLP